MTPPSSSYKSYRSYKSYASVTPPQHAYPRCHQAAKHYPSGNSASCLTQWSLFRSSPKETATCKPTGYTVTHPIHLAYPAYPAYSAYASVTPPQHAYPRCHQAAKHYPAVTLRAALPSGNSLPEPQGIPPLLFQFFYNIRSDGFGSHIVFCSDFRNFSVTDDFVGPAVICAQKPGRGVDI